MLLTELGALDEVLQAHAAELGDDFTGYRNHTYRVVNLCVALSSGGPTTIDKIVVAAAFHDLGIWTDGTFDYLAPSVRLAGAHLMETGRSDWLPEVTAMIAKHHKISRDRRDPHPLVEAFRRADWVDVSMGAIRFGLGRAFLREIAAAWPSAGFHRRLVQLSLQRWRTHPLSPFPMLRL
jgi:hypothetical protein